MQRVICDGRKFYAIEQDGARRVQRQVHGHRGPVRRLPSLRPVRLQDRQGRRPVRRRERPVLVLAALLANFLAGVVRGATGSDLLANIARYAIIVYAVFAALTQLGIAVQLTAPTFLIILGAVALAAAIAFGFGAQGVARDIVQK